MLLQGYRVVYSYIYGHPTTNNELSSIKSMCSLNSILCAAGAALGSDTLLLVSCGNCLSILSETVLNKPVLNNGAYWYLTTGQSFGFSLNINILQVTCDFDDHSDDYRLCWHLDGGGGWRIGKILWLNSDSNYNKILLLKN